MFNSLQASGVQWMRFYEFQWPAVGGANCDMVLQTAAKEADAGVPLIVHGFIGPVLFSRQKFTLDECHWIPRLLA
jgi:hypothetical protein